MSTLAGDRQRELRRPTRRSSRDTALAVRAALAVGFKYLSLLFWCFVALVPLAVIFMASFKTAAEYESTSPFSPPHSWVNFHNYAIYISKGHAVKSFINTGIILAFSISATVVIGSMAAYALDRFEFRLRRTVLFLFLLATLVPGVTTQVATYRVVNFFHLIDTRWAAIVLFAGTDIISIYIFMQFMRGIPRELDEAAALDGANRFTVFWRVIFPLLRPAIATVVIIKGVAIYNDFYTPFLYMPGDDNVVLSTSLFRFRGPYSASWEVISAGVILVIVPTLVAFLTLQRYFYNGFTSGATK